MTVADQLRAFAAMMLCGACTGAAYDLLALFRRNALCTAAADLLLGLILSAAVIGAGILLGCDPFRLYTLLGVGLGYAAYMLSLGTIVRILMRFFIKLSKKVTNSTETGKNMQENRK